MKTLALTLGIVAALSPLSALAFNINEYETQTQVATRFVSGNLDARLIEIGSNFMTKEFMPIQASTVKRGVVAYCAFYFRTTGKNTAQCDRTIKVQAINGNYSF